MPKEARLREFEVAPRRRIYVSFFALVLTVDAYLPQGVHHRGKISSFGVKSVITLLTDFGLEDAYVGVMKGVILGINPEARIVDLCHNVEPGNIREAAFILSTAYNFFPKGTIHLVVVDPGVGTGRRPLLVSSAGYYFIAPDNGVLSYIVAQNPYQAFELSNPQYWLKEISQTFHGRDIFAPAAAYLSQGISPEELGIPINTIASFPIPTPRREGKEIYGEVIHVDRFGNLITNIRKEGLPSGELIIELEGYRIEGLSLSYAEGGEILALIDSAGYLEVAAKNDSASKKLQIETGYPVKVMLL